MTVQIKLRKKCCNHAVSSKMIIGKMDNSGKNGFHFMPQLSMFTDPYNFPLKGQNGKSFSLAI